LLQDAGTLEGNTLSGEWFVIPTSGKVERLIEELGAMPVDAGPLTSARYIEPAMMLLVSLAYAGEPRDIGLRLLERTSA
jgi:hypothetical protein